MKLLFILFLATMLIFGFLLWTKKYSNPYSLTIIFGAPGSGKSMISAKLAYNFSKRGFRVLATDQNIPYSEFISPSEIGSFWLPENSVLIIEEASTVFNNRNWKNMSQDTIKWFKYLRHNKIRVFALSQDYSDLDVTLRRLCRRYYLMDCYCNVFIVARRIIKGITLSQPVGEQAGSIVDNFTFAPFLAPNSRMYAFVPRWCKEYDSFSKLDLPDWDSNPRLKKVS